MPSPNELKILDIIALGALSTQRDLADACGFSLGLTNAIIKRLARTGYIKTNNLNAKKMRYILSPKGMAELSRRSCNYILGTIRVYHVCLDAIKTLINSEITAGKRQFIIKGDGEIAGLVEIALKDTGRKDVTFLKHGGAGFLKNYGSDTAVLDCGIKPNGNRNGVINVIERLLEQTKSG